MHNDVGDRLQQVFLALRMGKIQAPGGHGTGVFERQVARVVVEVEAELAVVVQPPRQRDLLARAPFGTRAATGAIHFVAGLGQGGLDVLVGSQGAGH